jgi:hypothetical protein
VRRLTLAVFQINLARHQVNIAGASQGTKVIGASPAVE